jgi:hypothetical protein
VSVSVFDHVKTQRISIQNNIFGRMYGLAVTMEIVRRTTSRNININRILRLLLPLHKIFLQFQIAIRKRKISKLEKGKNSNLAHF